MQVDRLYHANALLLPDARAMTAGSNLSGRVKELYIELFHHPYFFAGDRPKISEYPRISYRRRFEIEIPASRDIMRVAVFRPSATTLWVNTEQRYVGLEFNRKYSSTPLVNVPSNKNILLLVIICSLL
jgi:hypothetical protein